MPHIHHHTMQILSGSIARLPPVHNPEKQPRCSMMWLLNNNRAAVSAVNILFDDDTGGTGSLTGLQPGDPPAHGPPVDRTTATAASATTTPTGNSTASTRRQTDTSGEPSAQANLPECSANVLPPYIRVRRIEPTKCGPTLEVLPPRAPPLSPSALVTTRTRESMIVQSLSATLYHISVREQRQEPQLPHHRATGLPGTPRITTLRVPFFRSLSFVRHSP
jgi:hypothetical protein